jgi:beta-lactamase class A
MAFALVPEVPAPLDPPAVVAPASGEVSSGRVAGRVAPGTHRVVVQVDGKMRAEGRPRGARFQLPVALPARDATVRVVAHDALGNRAARTVRGVFGLGPGLAASGARPWEDAALARKIDALVRKFPGISAVYVENLRTGAGAAWNARARFPAASTVKLAIAVEVLRVLEARPPPGSSFGRLLSLMLVDSDNEAANALLEWLGGTDEGGAGRVNDTIAALGLGDSQLYGGFLTASSRAPIPLTVESQPAFVGKYTTAWDLARLHRFVHLAAGDRGPLLARLEGSFTGADARYLLYLLAHSSDRGKLDRYLDGEAAVPHKAGWVTEARHDAGIVYGQDAAFVVAVMTWTDGEAGKPSDELAGRVARAALDHFRGERGEGGGAGGSPSSS